MATVNTNDLRIQNAKNLITALNTPPFGSRGYLFVGRPSPWTDESDTSISDENPPVPQNNWRDFYRTYDQMLSLKRLSNTDAFHVIPKVTWQSGITFDMYRHDYSFKNPSSSGATDLYDCVFYTINQNNDVFVCLYNGATPENRRGVASTVEPQTVGTEPFYTSDGYQWLYLYTLSFYYLNDKVTDNFMPVPFDENTGRVDGAVFTALVNSGGSNYSSHPDGVVNDIPYYFCHIRGDGEGAVARVAVINGSIQSIEVVTPGSGYTNATVDFSPNNVYKSLADLTNNVNGLNPLGDGTFDSTVIIGPPGGWGTDFVRELGGTRVALYSNLSYDLYDFISEVEFRQLGVLHDPEFGSEVPENPDTASAHYGIHCLEDKDLAFVVGETIQQQVPGGTAVGQFLGWDPQNQVLRYIQDPRYHTHVDGKLYRFTGTAEVVGLTSNKKVTPSDFTGRHPNAEVSLTFQDGYADPEVIKYTGSFLYLTNIRPVLRQRSQSEKITLVISY